MSYIGGISLVVLTLNLILGIVVLMKNRRALVNRLFFVLTLSVAVWIGGLQLITPQIYEANLAIAHLGLRIAFAGGALISFFFPMLVIYFPRQTVRVRKIFIAAYALVTLFFVYVSLFTHLIVLRVSEPETLGYKALYGPLYVPFGLYFIFVMGLGLFRLFLKERKMTGIEKLQVRYFLIGAAISVASATTTNLIYPLLTGESAFSKVGPLFTIFLVAFTFYAILKHHLMNVRVIGTEIFTVLTIGILLLQIFYARDTSDLLTRIAMFLFAVIFGYFLVRGTLREVETLRRLSEAKTEFISIASHQLRSPLTAIKGYISMILEGSFGKITEEQKKVLEKVYGSNERLSGLIDDLLDISRIEEGRMRFEMKPIAIVPFLAEIADDLRGAVDAEKTLRFRADESAKNNAIVTGDAQKLRQVFVNLIDNAIRYTPKGEIEVWCRCGGRKVRVEVKDSGIGIPKNELREIFERFSRGRQGATHYTEGAGLGLYIAKKIVEAHKGRIWAESAGIGKGATFIVELPLVQ